MSSIGVRCATCSLATMSDAAAEGSADQRGLQRRQALRHRRARAHRQPRRRDAPVGADLDDARHHGDRDHQIPARAELEEMAAHVAAAGFGTRMAVTISSARMPSADSRSGIRASAHGACRRRWPARSPHPAPAGWAAHRPPARPCKDCRRWCRGSGSARRRLPCAASFRPSNSAGSSAAISSLQVVSAPIRQCEPASAMPRSSASRVMSSTSLWRMSPQAERAALAGYTSVPPANTITSPAARIASASCNVAGR